MKESEIYARYVAQSNKLWGNTNSLPEVIEACYRSNPFLLEDLSNLRICAHCLELYGQVRLGNGEAINQECLCVKKTEGRWDGYDFNKKYETCYCCGLEVIPSGSKWSVFYCKDCKDKISELNREARQLIIPVGRHSIMNSIVLTDEQIQNKSAVNRFVCRVNNMNAKIDLVDNHRKKILAKQVRFLKVSKDAPIIDLIVRTNDLELHQRKADAFFELLASYTNMSVEEVQSIYNELLK